MSGSYRPRRWQGMVGRVAVVVGMLGGTLLLLRPAPTSGRAGRGHFSHRAGAESLAEGYEVKDLSAKGLAYVLLGLLVAAAFLVGIAIFLVGLFGRWDADRYADLTTQQTAPVTPPSPHILVHPEEDLERLRARELHYLNSYAWTDPQHDHAHVPIARGMQLVNGHSLDESP